MAVEVISVGTELLLENIVNTNAQHLAEKCAQPGLPLYCQIVVDDSHDRLLDVVKTGLNKTDVLTLTGDLGPTEDDITKEVCTETMGSLLVEDTHTRELIEEYFKSGIYEETPDNNWEQAIVSEGATVPDSHNGMVPGSILEKGGETAVLLPGPLSELYPLFEEQIYPEFQKPRPEAIFSQTVGVCGIRESQAEDKLIDTIDSQTNPTTVPYAETGEVHPRITAAAKDEAETRELIKPVAKKIKKRLGNMVYSVKGETLEMMAVCLLEKYGLMVTTAKFYTGGMLTARLANMSGVLEVLRGGFITYSGKAKKKIPDVNKATPRKYEAVSKGVTKEMATGGAFATDAGVYTAIIGLAGPDGATEEKSVGLVYIACHMKGKMIAKRYQFKGNYNKIREQLAVKALDLLRRSILKNYSK